MLFSVDASSSRALQYLSLRTAAALAYMRLVGDSPDASDTSILRRVLDDIAHALAIIAPIHFYSVAGGKLEQIEERFLLGGRFVRGAAALLCTDGREYNNLVIQRGELDAAISILQQTRLAEALRAAHGQAEEKS
jgi:hypothetical protein